jgi:hypothetical protein
MIHSLYAPHLKRKTFHSLLYGKIDELPTPALKQHYMELIKIQYGAFHLFKQHI